MTTGADSPEVHPLELVTVNVCEPAVRPATVTVEVEPVMPPGLTVQLPAGSPPRTTLPVCTAQVGWVMVPIEGGEGSGLTVTVVAADDRLWQPLASVTLTV